MFYPKEQGKLGLGQVFFLSHQTSFHSKHDSAVKNNGNTSRALDVFFSSFLCRVALIFRVRSAQKLALSDGVLFRRLCLLVLLYCSYLTAWTAFHPPVVETARTSGDLKYERCVENWFNLTLIFGKTGIIFGITYFAKTFTFTFIQVIHKSIAITWI